MAEHAARWLVFKVINRTCNCTDVLFTWRFKQTSGTCGDWWDYLQDEPVFNSACHPVHVITCLRFSIYGLVMLEVSGGRRNVYTDILLKPPGVVTFDPLWHTITANQFIWLIETTWWIDCGCIPTTFFPCSRTRGAKQSEPGVTRGQTPEAFPPPPRLQSNGAGSLLNLTSEWHLKWETAGAISCKGNTEARPLLHSVWWPSAQQGSWKDFKGTVSEPCWFHVLPSSFVTVLTTPAGQTVAAWLSCERQTEPSVFSWCLN